MGSDLPNWIQAGATIVLTGITGWTLKVLRDYAADTKRMAQSGVDQSENSQMPFVVLAEQTGPYRTCRWMIHNQGFGPAVNIYHSRWRAPALPTIMTSTPPLAPTEKTMVDDNSANIRTEKPGFIIEYESLSGKKYRTVVFQHGDESKTTFERL
jgi:hypothetical protein